MYGMIGGCTTLFHLAVKHPLLVLAFGIAGFASQIPANPGPGDRLGTSQMLAQIEEKVVDSNPDIDDRMASLQNEFSRNMTQATRSDVSRLLDSTDVCTETRTNDIFDDAERLREANWLIFLDSHSRDRP